MPGEPLVELVEEVDDGGRAVRVVTRAEMRAGNLRHRSVGIVVRHPVDPTILVHRRAGWKDVWPGRWDICFGGVCGVGEPEVESARRELAEEAGVEVDAGDLQPLGSGSYEDDDVRAFATVFEVRSEGPFTFADGEVEEVRWLPIADLEAFLATHPHCPDSAALVRSIRPWGNER
ncbi:MAG TPA: NUDIX domain-containing protein [Acidimicrobiales bacterium]|nr:NUDIX domain-containing protein [Acidimicrobiales bacterium]